MTGDRPIGSVSGIPIGISNWGNQIVTYPMTSRSPTAGAGASGHWRPGRGCALQALLLANCCHLVIFNTVLRNQDTIILVFVPCLFLKQIHAMRLLIRIYVLIELTYSWLAVLLDRLSDCLTNKCTAITWSARKCEFEELGFSFHIPLCIFCFFSSHVIVTT